MPPENAESKRKVDKMTPSPHLLPHAFDRIESWSRAWRESGAIILLLDFDGTLAPIVDQPEQAGMPPETRATVERLIDRPDTHIAIISGRGLADVRRRAGLGDIIYGGNHGMEIDGAGIHRIHPEAAAARPALEAFIDRITPALAEIDGVFIEDKQLTLSVHYRAVDRELVDRVKEIVHRAADIDGDLRLVGGKEVLEVRPAVDWHKGRAVDFLLTTLRIPSGSPLLYIGDDTTDEDAFETLVRHERGEGIIVADPPPTETKAKAYVRTTEEVARLLDLLVVNAPS